MWLVQKLMWKFDHFSVKWIINGKNDKHHGIYYFLIKISLYIDFFSMNLIYKFLIWWLSIFILTLIWHTFWIHILHYYICMINLMLSFWKFIMNKLLKINQSIFFNIILIKVYYNMDNLNFDNVNVEYDFAY